MEPQALKDYLENLLSERSDRLMGGVIKHFGSDLCPSDLCYKEVMPASQTQQMQPQPTPQPAAEMPQTNCGTAAANQQPTAMPTYQSCTAEAYQNYALNALKNLATMFTTAPEASPAANCVEATQQVQQTEQCAQPVQLVNVPSPAVNCQTAPASQPNCGMEVMQPTEVMQVNLLISQQLERMEHMLREMYITNQELFKSIIVYCREHADN